MKPIFTEKWNALWRFFNFKSVLAFRDCQELDAKTKNKNSQIKKNKGIESVNHEIKSAVMKNYELEYPKNDKTSSGSLAFLNYQKSTARYEIKAF